MELWKLPEALEVGGRDCTIRTDYRDIIMTLIAFNDPELSDMDKFLTMLDIMYPEFEISEDRGCLYIKDRDRYLTQNEVDEAVNAATCFIDAGVPKEHKHRPRTMDWEQDAPIIFPAVNKVAGKDVRSVKHMHWWTFLGYFMELSEGTFMQVLGIRQKKAAGKHLEKWEDKFYRDNLSLCVLHKKYTKDEQEKLDRLNKMLD